MMLIYKHPKRSISAKTYPIDGITIMGGGASAIRSGELAIPAATDWIRSHEVKVGGSLKVHPYGTREYIKGGA